MPRRQSSLQRWILFAAAIIAAAAGAALLALRYAGSDATTTSGQALPHDAPPAAILSRTLCSLSNDDASRTFVAGHDGGMSVVLGDTTWWLFGDTLFVGESGKQIEQNSIASSTSLRPDGCPRLDYHTNERGIAIPFLPKDGSLTSWPTGAWPVDDHTFDFYTAYVYGSGPFSYTIDEVGIARLDTRSMQVTVLARELWSRDAGFPTHVIMAQPVEVADDGLLRVVLHTDAVTKLLARVPAARIAESQAYEFWDGDGWSPDPSRATALWTVDPPDGPVEQLAAFENGASIAWNPSIRKYVALVNTGFDSVGARIADRLEGPWSEPVRYLSCLDFARPRVPACYSPLQHTQLASEDGRVLYTTISAIEPYETHVVEITLGDAVHEYRRGDEVTYATAMSGDQWEDEGIAFYASASPRDGLVAVYAWTSGDVTRLAPRAPGDGWQQGGAVFYAAPSPRIDGSLTDYRPVYSWTNREAHVLSPLASGLEQYGYTRGDVMFYVP